MNVVLRIEQVRVIEFCSFLYIFILPEQEQIECCLKQFRIEQGNTGYSPINGV